jgi:hypothetical protein
MQQNPEMTLQFVCPKTQKPLPVPSERGSAYVAEHWNAEVMVPCPHCAADHTFFFKQGFMAGSIDVTDGIPPTLLAGVQS